MEEKYHFSRLIRDLTEHLEGTEPACEDLIDAVNAIIDKYHLHISVVVSLMARLSAGCIHLAQRAYTDAGADVVVEEDFLNMLEASLHDLDAKDVAAEVEKMKRQELN